MGGKGLWAGEPQLEGQDGSRQIVVGEGKEEINVDAKESRGAEASKRGREEQTRHSYAGWGRRRELQEGRGWESKAEGRQKSHHSLSVFLRSSAQS